MLRNSLYIFTNELFGDSLWKVKQCSSKKTKLNFPVIVLSKNKQSWFVFNLSFVIEKFPAWLVCETI